MRIPLLASVLLTVVIAPASGQSGTLNTSAQQFTFGDPSGVGLRSYSMISSSLVTTYPIRPWITAGTATRFTRASMSARGITSVDVSGLSGVEVSSAARFGALKLRGAFAPSVRGAGLTPDEIVVTSLAASEAMPFPTRQWAFDNRYSLDAGLDLGSGGYTVELLGSLRRHGWFTPFRNDPMRYRIGSEIRLALTASRRPSALRWTEVGAWISKSGSDRTNVQEVFEPGLRATLHAATVFPVGATTLLLRGELYHRHDGRVLDPITTVEGVPVAVLGGGVDSPVRTVGSVMLESRSALGSLPLVATLGGRYGYGAGETLLGWGGLATEIEIRPPLAGRWFVVPAGRIYRGSIELDSVYGSSVVAWELGAELRWEGR